MRIRLEEATAQFALEVSSALVRRQQTNNRGRPGFHGGTRCRAGYVPRRRRHCRAGYVHAPAVRSSVDGLPAGRKASSDPCSKTKMRAGMTGVSDGCAGATHQDER